MDYGAIDFVGVAVGNMTPLWLIPFPFPFTQWFPHTPLLVTSGVLFGVKDQFSGESFYVPPEESIVVLPPEWAIFTENTEEYVVLTVFRPATNRAMNPVAPRQHRLLKGSKEAS
jgi:hypothetical protein